MSPTDQLISQRRLAIVGVAKNCGKTTTLNRLLRARRAKKGSSPAVVSVGVDGESEDVLLGTEKPPVYVEAGQWVATAEVALRRAEARFEYVQSLEGSTPLGEVFVCRAVEPGTVMLGGLRHRRELSRAVDVLAELSAGPVWIDGAYGRVVGAHPDVADAVVVATGAICGDDVEEVVERTGELVSRLEIPVVDDDDEIGRRAIERAVDDDSVVLVDARRGLVPLATPSAVVGLEEMARQWASTVEAVAIPGLISDRVVEELLAIGDGRRLYIRDGTVIHTDADVWNRLRSRWELRADRTTDVVAISYNPTAVTSAAFNARSLKDALRNRFSDVPVFDPMSL